MPSLPIAHDHPAAEVRLVLVHSPLVGPDTWGPVAETLRARACQVLVPRLSDHRAPPWWAAHVEAIVESIGDAGADPSPLLLILHSGAGQLADHLVARLDEDGHTVEAAVFADAGLPPEGRSRMAQLRLEAPMFAADLRDRLAAGDRFPDWTDAQLRDLVPDGARRRRLLDGVRSLPPEYWEEPIPAVEVPAHHRGAVLFSDGYAPTREAAEEEGWPLVDLAADNHFLALDDEVVVAEAILGVIDAMLIHPDEGR